MLSIRGALSEEDFIKIGIEVRAYLISRDNSRKNYHRGTKCLDMFAKNEQANPKVV